MTSSNALESAEHDFSKCTFLAFLPQQYLFTKTDEAKTNNINYYLSFVFFFSPEKDLETRFQVQVVDLEGTENTSRGVSQRDRDGSGANKGGIIRTGSPAGSWSLLLMGKSGHQCREYI